MKRLQRNDIPKLDLPEIIIPRYTGHAEAKAIINKLKLPSVLALCKMQLVEVVLSDVSGKISSYCFVEPHTSKYFVAYIIDNDLKTVITVYLKAKRDLQ